MFFFCLLIAAEAYNFAFHHGYDRLLDGELLLRRGSFLPRRHHYHLHGQCGGRVWHFPFGCRAVRKRCACHECAAHCAIDDLLWIFPQQFVNIQLFYD